MQKSPLSVFRCVLLACAATATTNAGDWPGFRGPTADGVVPETDQPPLQWSETENLRWRTDLPGPGSSSPIVSGRRVYLSCYSGYGLDKTDPGDIAQLKRHALCLDAATGKILWDRTVAGTSTERPFQGEYITTHGYASSTPVTDGKAVYFFFAHAGVHAYSLDGQPLWEANVGTKAHDWGAGSSPVVYGELLIVNASLESDTLFALDRKTGREVWSVKGFPSSWNTPVIAHVSGHDELIVNASGKLRAFDPATGAELWQCAAIRAAELCPSVLVHDDVCFVVGHPGGECMAVRIGGNGDVTQTHVLWRLKKGSNVGSPVWHDGHLYFANDSRGIAYCLKADTGEVVYEEKLSDSRDRWYASPILSGDRIYYHSRTSGTVVLAAQPRFEVLAVNRLASDRSISNASPAVAGGRLFLRTNQAAYCFGEK
ncbi:MAG: PQQ-binding-like beta-propeller repeat protein [Verrucomicrobiae bacterium]|nr:PQQ-binding-like beta-propeller repeat protein [Verrucomicrobiae bacterium]